MRRNVKILGLKFSLFILIAGALPYSGQRANAEDKIRIGISSTSPGFLPTIVAEKKGFFSKHGLVSEHIRISLAVAMNALGTGDLDYAITMAQGVSAAVTGIPVKLVMMTQDKLVFFLMAKTPIQRVADLKNKIIGITTWEARRIWWQTSY
jgi:ABC-type nitrate/sulfonate/bicarbonate transport system substrate-binding protein